MTITAVMLAAAAQDICGRVNYFQVDLSIPRDPSDVEVSDVKVSQVKARRN